MEEQVTDSIEQVDEQQQPPKKYKVKEFAAKIKAKYPEYKDIDDKLLTEKIIAKYPVYKDQIDYTPDKKKVGTVVIGQNYSSPELDLETPSTLPTKEYYNTTNGELVEGDPISMSKKYTELVNRKKQVSQPIGSSFAMGTNLTEEPDEEAIKAAKKIKEDLGDIDPVELNTELNGVSDDDLKMYGDELLRDRKENKQLYQRKVARLKWQPQLDNALNDAFDRGRLDEQGLHDLKSAINYSLQNSNIGSYQQQRQNISTVANAIKEFGGENKDKILHDYAIEVGKVYGNAYKNGLAKSTEGTPESKYLNEDEQLGLNYIQDISPELASQYDRLKIDPKELKNNPDALKGYNQLKEKLEQTGLFLQQNAVQEELNNIIKISNKNNGLTPEQLSQAQELENKQHELTDKVNEMDKKYPDRVTNKISDAVQELLGQNLSYGKYAFLQTGRSVENTLEGIWEGVSTPFMSDASNTLRELAIMGSEPEFHKTDKNKNLLTDRLVIQPELQSKIDTLLNNKLLNSDQKRSQLYQLLSENLDKFGRVPIQGGKLNISPSSILYGITDLGTSLLPFVALETVTGGGATAGIARKFLSTFTSAAATSFHDEYAAAIKDGLPQSEAYKRAMGMTAITSAAMAGALTPQKIRAILKPNTSAGKIISEMSDDAIQKALDNTGNKTMAALKNRIKATPGMFKQGAKAGAEFELAMGAANEFKHQIYNTPIDREQNFKQSLLGIANFGILGAGLGHIGYKSPTELQKSGLLEFGRKPEEYQFHLQEMKKDGQISEAEFDHRKELINKASEVYKTIPKADDKGKPLDERQKSEYLYNAIIKNDGKKASSTMPPKQAEKAEHTSLVADYANGIILENPTLDELNKRSKLLQDKLEPKKDAAGKLINISDRERKNYEAELEAVKDAINIKEEPIKVPERPAEEGKPEEISQPIELSVEPTEDKLIQSYRDKTGVTKEQVSDEDLLRNISEQAQNISGGKVNETGNEKQLYENTVQQAGKELVDAAIEKYPKEKLLNENKNAEVQQPTEVKEPSVEEANKVEPTAGEGGKEPPNEEPTTEGAFVEPKRTQFSHKGLQEVATEFGLNNITSREKVTDLELFRGADETISKWEKEGTYTENVDRLIAKAKEGEIFSPEENVIMAQHIANLREKTAVIREKYGIDSSEYNKALKELQSITTIGQKVRSDIGAALRVPTLSRIYIPTLDDAMTAKMDAKRVDVLTDKEKAQTVKEFEEIKAARDKAENLAKEANAKFEEMKAENELLRQQLAAKGKKTEKVYTNGKRDFNAEIKNYKDELKKLVDEYKTAGQKLGISSDGGTESFVISTKMAKVIMKIAQVHVEQVGVKIAEITKRTFETVKDLFPGITEKDIRDVFSGKYNEKKLTKNEIAAQMRELSVEAKLLIEYENLLKGGEPKNELRRQKRNQRLSDIQKQIDELNKERGTGKYSDEQIAKRAIESNKRKKAEFERKLKEGDFEKQKQPTSIYDSPEFRKKNPKLYNELLDSQNEAHEKQLEFERKLNEEDMKGWGWTDWLRHIVKKSSGTLKQVFASFDASAIAVQNLPMIVSNPIIGSKGIKHSFKEFASQKEFDRHLTELHNSPDWPMIKKCIRVTEPKSLLESGREEYFPDRFKAIIKIKGKEYGWIKTKNGKYELLDISKPFERQFTSLGNWLRVVKFRTEAEKLYQQGYTWEKNPEKFEALGKRINNLTSSPDIPQAYQNELTRTLIWSTRLIAAKLNMLGISDLAALLPGTGVKKGYYRGLGEKGKIISKQQAYAVADLAKFATSVVTATYLYAMARGGKVNTDPDSNSFLDVEYGDGKSMNFTGGFSRYISLLFQLYEGGRRDKSGVFNPYANKGTDRLKEVAGFVRGKAPPMTASAMNLIAGKNMANQETDAATEAAKYKMPLALGQIKQQIDKDGYSSLFKEGILTFIGFNSKDQRDYIDQDINIPEVKYMADKGVRIMPYKRESLKPLTTDGKPIEVTDEKYDEFIKKREEYILKDVKDLMDGKKHIQDLDTEEATTESGAVTQVPRWSKLSKDEVDKLTTDEVKGFVMTATKRADEKAIHDVFKGRGNAPKKTGKRKIE